MHGWLLHQVKFGNLALFDLLGSEKVVCNMQSHNYIFTC